MNLTIMNQLNSNASEMKSLDESNNLRFLRRFWKCLFRLQKSRCRAFRLIAVSTRNDLCEAKLPNTLFKLTNKKFTAMTLDRTEASQFHVKCGV